MSATTGPGTGSSTGAANTTYLNFPSVPFTTEHFNPYCSLDWNSQTSIRDCWLIGLPDLNQRNQHVRDMEIALLNHLIDLGVAGFRYSLIEHTSVTRNHKIYFRFDAFKHMWPEDLEVILGQMKNLNTNYGFAANSRPFVVGEVIQGDGIY